MSSLYNKYRPVVFSSVVGQEEVVTTLTNQIISGNVGHAYLFSGTRGTGKTSLSKIFSRAVNCLAPINGEPCGTCKACCNVHTLDIIEFDAASNNSVDDIRDIRDRVAYPPTENNYKVYIIDEVHMLSRGAFNALLKTLEEPPAYIIFLLCTTEPHKIPATILSRCSKFELKRITVNDIVGRMQYVLETEGKEADVGALQLIAGNSDGAMRDALSMLEQAIYLSGKERVTEGIVSNMLGCTNIEVVLTLVRSVLDLNLGSIMNLLSFLTEQGKDMSILLQDIILILRDCMLVKAAGIECSLKMGIEYKTCIQEMVATVSIEKILYMINEINALANKAKFSLNPVITVETGMTMMCLPVLSRGSDISSIVAKMNVLEDKVNHLLSSGKTVTREIVIEKHDPKSISTNLDATFQQGQVDPIAGDNDITVQRADVKEAVFAERVLDLPGTGPSLDVDVSDPYPDKEILHEFEVKSSRASTDVDVLEPYTDEKISQVVAEKGSVKQETDLFDGLSLGVSSNLDASESGFGTLSTPNIHSFSIEIEYVADVIEKFIREQYVNNLPDSKDAGNLVLVIEDMLSRYPDHRYNITSENELRSELYKVLSSTLSLGNAIKAINMLLMDDVKTGKKLMLESMHITDDKTPPWEGKSERGTASSVLGFIDSLKKEDVLFQVIMRNSTILDSSEKSITISTIPGYALYFDGIFNEKFESAGYEINFKM